MDILTRPAARALLGAAYFVAVNLLSGYIAESFRYPSLWAHDEVFGEYAFPVIWTYALVHWITMLPMTLVVMGMPTWSRAMLIRARWILLSVVILCIGVDMGYGGPWRRMPFLLFPIVDAGLALLLALIFKPPLKLMAITAVTAASLAALWFAAPSTVDTRQDLNEPAPASMPLTTVPPVEESRFLIASEPDSSDLKNGGEVIYRVEIAPTVEPGQPPTPERICEEARDLFEDLLRQYEWKAEFSRMEFRSHPWFEDRRKYIYPSGSASFDRRHQWHCDFVYPDPSTKP